MDVPRNDDDNGTWNPRPERTVPDAGRYAPRGGNPGNGGNSGKVSKNTPNGGSPSRGYEATSSTITRSEPYRQPMPSRAYDPSPSRSRTVDAPRMDKSPKFSGERSMPRSEPRSEPRYSQPRASQPRVSQPRAERSSSAPRQSSGGNGGGGYSGKGAKGGKQRD